MAHAYVTDVPASWENYERVSVTLDSLRAEGLILHAAGRTDEGFRIIEVWESREAWGRARDRAPEWWAGDRTGERPATEPVVRELTVERLIRR